jgi:Fe-S-cluster containining protein
MILELSRPYSSRAGRPIVHRVDTGIFHETFFSACMDCTFCYDTCCQYGATVEEPMAASIKARADELEAYLGVPRGQWFEDGMKADEDYPGGRYTRTRVIDGSCAFLSRTGRGCMLHRFCLEKGVDVHELKPMACQMFPVMWEDGVLIPPVEVEDRTLVCIGNGPTLYRSARRDLLFFFGPELVAELDAIEATQVRPTAAANGSGILSLPIVAEVEPSGTASS